MQRSLIFYAVLLVNSVLFTGSLHAADGPAQASSGRFRNLRNNPENSTSVQSGSLNSDKGTRKSAEAFLRRFHADPKKVMQELPPEVKNAQVFPRGMLNAQSLDRNLIQSKFDLRTTIMKRSTPQIGAFSAYLGNDDPANLIDTVPVRNLVEIDRQGMSRHELPYTMWSDSYWPIQKGLLAVRYNDPDFPDSKEWESNYGYSRSRPAAEIAASGDMEAINNLSPSEKYDLLVGDSNFTLTEFSWKTGQKYIDSAGFVPGWVGICHGWSAAAHMQAPIPYGSIVLRSASGLPITFYQSDVKALTSLLWANASPGSKFLGSKCGKSNPPVDSNGRVTAPECLDNNAGTYFTVITNQLGMNNRSFVMDATFDAEVWNYPIASYKMTYFNPQSLITTDNVNGAIIPLASYNLDKFRSYRSPETRYVAGVIMDVTFLNEVNASHGVQNKPTTKVYRYFFDLEMDANQNIIGGEWYTQSHPDFIWTYAKGAKAVTRAEAGLNASEWNVSAPLPQSWMAAAQRASANGSPLAVIIQRIVEAAPKAEYTIDSDHP